MAELASLKRVTYFEPNRKPGNAASTPLPPAGLAI